MSVEGTAGHGTWSVDPRSVVSARSARPEFVDDAVRSRLRRERWAAIGMALGAVFVGPFAPVAWVVIIINFFRRVEDRGERVLLLKQLGVAIAGVPSAIFVFFIVGETMTDPGGLRGLALLMLWSLPVMAVTSVSWNRPRMASLGVGLMVMGVVAMDVWFAVDVERWRSFEDRRGPVSAVATFVVVAVTIVLAWRRPAVGGSFMLVVPTAAGVLALFVHELTPHALASAVVGSIPGALFVASAFVGRPRRPIVRR